MKKERIVRDGWLASEKSDSLKIAFFPIGLRHAMTRERASKNAKKNDDKLALEKKTENRRG